MSLHECPNNDFLLLVLFHCFYLTVLKLFFLKNSPIFFFGPKFILYALLGDTVIFCQLQRQHILLVPLYKYLLSSEEQSQVLVLKDPVHYLELIEIAISKKLN